MEALCGITAVSRLLLYSGAAIVIVSRVLGSICC